MISSPLAASTIRLARVTYVHPEGQKMEVIFLDTGDYGRDVQVMTPYGGTDFGFTGGIPSPDEEGHDVNLEDNDSGKRHILAVIATLQGLHVCLGYLYPQVTQMAFTKADKNRLIERHTSDFVRTISDAGDMDMVHPSGAHLRIGSGTTPDNLAGKDFDGVFALKHNTGSTPTITLENSTGGGTSRIKQTPGGYIDMYAQENLTITTEGFIEVVDGEYLTAQVEQYVDVTAKENIALNAFADCTVDAVNVRIKASQNALLSGGVVAKVKGPDVILEGAVQVTSDAPLTYVKGALIVAGNMLVNGAGGLENGTVTIHASSVDIISPTINLTGIVNVYGDINI